MEALHLLPRSWLSWPKQGGRRAAGASPCVDNCLLSLPVRDCPNSLAVPLPSLHSLTCVGQGRGTASAHWALLLSLGWGRGAHIRPPQRGQRAGPPERVQGGPQGVRSLPQAACGVQAWVLALVGRSGYGPWLCQTESSRTTVSMGQG